MAKALLFCKKYEPLLPKYAAGAHRAGQRRTAPFQGPPRRQNEAKVPELFFDLNAYAVYLHTLGGVDQNIAAAVDDAGLHKVAVLGVHFDYHAGGAQFKLLFVHQIAGGQLGFFAASSPKCMAMYWRQSSIWFSMLSPLPVNLDLRE